MSFINNTVELLPRTAEAVVYSCPPDLLVTLSTITVYAPMAASGRLTLSLFRQSSGQTVRLLIAREVQPDQPYTHPKPIMLSPGDQLIAMASDEHLVIDVGGVVQGQTQSTGAFVPRGAFDLAATYGRRDLAEKDGNTYVCLVDGLVGEAPPSANWMLFAGKGQPGADGESILPADLKLKMALNGLLPSDEIIKKGNHWILIQDIYMQRDVDLTGITIESPFGANLILTETDPATRRDLPLIHEDETVGNLQALGTVYIAANTTLTVTGTLEVLPV